MKSHFSVSQPKSSGIRAREYLSQFRRATCPKEVSFLFCFPFFPTEFLVAASKSFLVHCHWPKQSRLSHNKAPFLLWRGFSSSHLQSFGFSHSFLSIWKTSSIIFIHKMGKPLDSPASFPPISLFFCISKLFESIFLSRLFIYLFRSQTPFSLPARPISALRNLPSIKLYFFLSLF